MFDTLAAAKELTDAGINPEHAAAITHTVQLATEQRDYVTRETLRAELAAQEVRLTAALAALERRVVGYAIAVAGIAIALLRWLG